MGFALSCRISACTRDLLMRGSIRWCDEADARNWLRGPIGLPSHLPDGNRSTKMEIACKFDGPST
jgi:hypothetical protein